MRRGKIAKAVSNGVSYYYYSMLKNTPVKEIMAGNITRGLIKDVFEENILWGEEEFKAPWWRDAWTHADSKGNQRE